MKEFDNISNIYFLGIGGIGMSALARYFKNLGKNIYGYDLTETPLTKLLENEGMKIHYADNPRYIPENIDLVIYTPAIPNENKEFIALKNRNVKLLKRAEILGILSRHYKTIAIAGTHGKTSITSIVAHLFHTAGIPITAFIGGISKNFNGNFIFDENAQFMIVEADEYDRSLLTLTPETALISSISPDHLDIYGNFNELKNTFITFINKIKNNIILNRNLTELLNTKNRIITYGLDKTANISAENIKIINGKFSFALNLPNGKKLNIVMKAPGKHTIENALGATAIALTAGIKPQNIKKGLETFKGVERRFDVKINTPEKVLIDDYAHHPDEINTTIDTARLLFKNRKITVVFQPHLFSRTRDLAMEFATTLDKADEIVLLPIYPAREKPIKGVTSKIIFDKMKNKNKKLSEKQNLINEIKTLNPDVLIAMGAGDIGFMINEIENILTNK